MTTITSKLAMLVMLGVATAATAQTCDEAWADYNEFKKRNAMEPSQYALTTYGATVRAACGPDALPVPPGTDTPPLPRVRKPKPLPPPPPPPPKPPKN
ncbi:MAG: hypothetical protein HYX45_08530 [Burkholderiales bacterium]|nr:hypothetical protein [Burkholderiales bacterium]